MRAVRAHLSDNESLVGSVKWQQLALGLPNVTVHPLGNLRQKTLNLMIDALCGNLHATIG